MISLYNKISYFIDLNGFKEQDLTVAEYKVLRFKRATNEHTIILIFVDGIKVGSILTNKDSINVFATLYFINKYLTEDYINNLVNEIAFMMKLELKLKDKLEIDTKKIKI